MVQYGNSLLSPVGFGAGEPNLQPLYDSVKQMGSYASSISVINLIIAVAASYFSSRTFISPYTAGLLGVMIAVSYPVVKQVFECLPIHQQETPCYEIRKKTLLLLSVLVASLTFSYSLERTNRLSSLVLSGMDIALVHYFSEAKSC